MGLVLTLFLAVVAALVFAVEAMGMVFTLVFSVFFALIGGLGVGLGVGLDLALRNGGWFVLLQKVALRRLARAGNLPPNPYDFLEWGVDRQLFRRVGGGVRFRHDLIQQHLAST